MKKGILIALAMTSLNVMAVDHEKYCIEYLNGELGTEKSDILADFKASAAEVDINGKKVSTVEFDFNSDVGSISKKETVFDAKKGSEIQSITVSKLNAKGKQVVDYTLEIVRDAEGRLVEVSRKDKLREFKKSSKIKFIAPNGICMPEEEFAGKGRVFSSPLCREIEEFFQNNKEARNCMESGYDVAIKKIVEKHMRGVQDLTKGLKSKRYQSSLLVGKAMGDCFDAGLIPMIEDNKAWVAPKPEVEDGDGEVPVKVKKN